ncbi:hypothetical protein K7432_006817 [Basidiobolus ranarum]|uniref:Uncharacterized protein n=1 Tax=Basidiobolus ranarum TaxID=34480 RepID=A0ABR2WUN4_9FUNG
MAPFAFELFPLEYQSSEPTNTANSSMPQSSIRPSTTKLATSGGIQLGGVPMVRENHTCVIKKSTPEHLYSLLMANTYVPPITETSIPQC